MQTAQTVIDDGLDEPVDAEAPARPPSIGRALRESAADLYFNSWRLVPANLVWSAVLIAILIAGSAFLPALLLLPLLAVPLAGLHRMAALIARGEAASFSDFTDGMRQFAKPAVTIGAVGMLFAVVFTTNVVIGIESGGPLGWALATTAVYGDVVLAMILVAVWSILVDPRRDDVPVRRRIMLAAMLGLGRPARMLAFTAVIGLLLVVSTVFLAILLISVAYASLVASRYVLPSVDLVEARLRR